MIVTEEKRYSATLTAGSLKVPESRIVADLLLRGLSKKEWDEVLYSQNILQARNPATARRLALLIRGQTLPHEAKTCGNWCEMDAASLQRRLASLQLLNIARYWEISWI